ncbi:MAG TPA: TonB-dependent receptor [Steroidobacteraceae bacterium]|nr:TonB-dependent receptor [Steroidobacteraceae bacterium]
MLYSSDDVRGITTHAVSGDFTVAQALNQMIAGTGLEITFENDFTFASIRPAKSGTGADVQGPTLAGQAGTARASARGMPDLPVQALAGEQKLEEVVVTGTLMHGVLDIVSPLQFVTRNDMKRTSYATVQDALNALTLSGGGGQSEDYAGNGNFARGVAANLRGLGSGATLVLINGHRQPFSGALGDFVDLSSIPWSAVERIEVLPDGASALYGSDAIAGVVNVIMRKDLQGAETWARLGTAPGGADEKLVAQLFGTNWDSGRFFFTYQYSERGSLAASARAYSADTDKRPSGGTDHRTFRSSPGNILDPRTLLPAFAIPSEPSGSILTVSDLIPGAVNLQNRYSTYELLPEKRMHSAFLSGSQDLGDRVQVFAEGRYSERNIAQEIYAFDQVLPVSAANPYAAKVNPYPTSPYVFVGYSFLDTLGPTSVDARTRTYSGSLGIKAELSQTWRLNLTGSYGRESDLSHTKNIPNPAALSAALNSTQLATAFNPFGGLSQNNPAVIDAIRWTQVDSSTSAVSSGTAIVDGSVLSLPSGDAKLAVGAELRKEQLGTVAGAGMPFARTIRSAFTELSLPIIGDASDPYAVPRLELSLANRYERYSDFGSTSNPKVGIRWAPSDSLKLRTSWGTSFKAPKLTDLHDESHNFAALTSFRDPTSATGSSIVLIKQTNNPDLKQETAKTWSAGADFVFKALPGSKLSLTYYSIDYTDRIVFPGLASPTDILLQEDQWASVIDRHPSSAEIDAICSASYFRGAAAQCGSAPIAAVVDFEWRNLASTRVKGLDLKFDQTIDTAAHGTFQLGLTGAYLLSFDQGVSKNVPPVDVRDTVGNPLALKLRGTAEWYQHGLNRPGFAVAFTTDHVGAYRNIDASLNRDVSATTTFDLQLSYRTRGDVGVLSDSEIVLNATNIFNSAPPFVDREEGYDSLNSEPYGRVVSFSIQKNW